MRFNRVAVVAASMGFLALLSGCFENYPLAPVVDAWHQKWDAKSRETPISHWQWPARGRLVQRYSNAPDEHPGISISGQLGEVVRAAADGSVVYSSDGVRGYGNLIIIKHNSGYLSAYAFNQQNLVSIGANVKRGQPIARMGRDDAGLTVLYFEIRKDGTPIDPMKLLP